MKSAVDHLELIRRDEAHEAVRPGASRMLEELDDRRNVAKLHLNLGLLAFFCAIVALLQPEISLGPRLLLISASVTELILAIQPIILRNWGLFPDLKYPMLSIYKPCQRDMNLAYPLTDLMEAYLDPWTKRTWRNWKNEFQNEIRIGRVIKSPEDALERLLLLEHLRLRKQLSSEEVDLQKKTFLSETNEIKNLDIEYFLLHLYGQCQGLFHLVDGMVEELSTDNPESDWSLDSKIHRHDYGADVFIRITNYSDSKEMVKLTITTPNAVPREQVSTLGINSSKLENKQYPLNDPLNENVIDSMTQLTNDSEIFWMSVSWSNKPATKVIITLENELDELILEHELMMPSSSNKNVLWFKALNRIERLASQGGLIPR